MVISLLSPTCWLMAEGQRGDDDGKRGQHLRRKYVGLSHMLAKMAEGQRRGDGTRNIAVTRTSTKRYVVVLLAI